MSELWSIPLVRISAAVGAAAAAITLLTPLWDRHLQTAGRRRVWCLLVLALLIAPWLHLPIPAAPAAAPSQAAAEEAVAVQVLPDTAPADPMQPLEPAPAGEASHGVPETAAVPSTRISPKAAAAGLYLAGVILFLLYQITGHLLFSRKVRRWARPVSDPALLAQYRVLTARDRRPPRLLVLPGLASPMLTGLLRPALLLPQGTEKPQTAQWVLRHELTHWRRRDLLWKVLALAANALHWFNPLVWLLRHRLDRDLEQSCDESVLQNADAADRRAYGAVILSAASGGRYPAVSTSLRGGAGALRHRLGRILDAPRKRGRGWSVLCGVLCLALVLSACVREEVPAEAGTADQTSGDTAAPEVTGERKSADIYTVLIAGQAGPDSNTDAILLASYDVTGQQMTVLNIPRDTMVNVPWDIKKIGSVYQYYGGGEEGMARLRETVTELVGFAPDYTIQVEWDAVGEMVDAMGGVYFDVPMDMDYEDPYQDLSIHISKGPQTLNGEQAMGVIRFREGKNGYSNGDIGRIETQQAFLKAMAEQLLQVQNLSKINQFTQVLAENVTTDLSPSNLLWFAQQAVLGGLQAEDIRFVTLPGEGVSAWSRTYHQHLSYIIPQQDALVELVNDSLSPFQSEVTREDLALMSVDSQGALHCTSGPVADTQAAAPVA
ncbi:M56 family metallopeptidase [Dysosmobacter sp.]|uniref:M56 family metallopeptidase n=1 Tax=Dysosmobacter sp. TaxID=2591382 RepID=UPI003FD795CB